MTAGGGAASRGKVSRLEEWCGRSIDARGAVLTTNDRPEERYDAVSAARSTAACTQTRRRTGGLSNHRGRRVNRGLQLQLLSRYRMNAPLLSLVAGVVLVAGAGLAAAQGSAQQAAQQPQFRAEIEYVEVDVIATDEQGMFVRDLARDDLQVLEDGERQEISSFALVDIPIERDAAPPFSSAPIEPDVGTNEQPFDGRVYVMVLDDLHVGAQRSERVKTAAQQFITRYLGANDLMAVLFTGGHRTQSFTSSKRLLTDAVNQFAGYKRPSITLSRNAELKSLSPIPGAGPVSGAVSPLDDQLRAADAETTLTTLRSVAQWLGGIRGRRKTLLFFSEGIDYDLTDLLRGPTSAPSGAPKILDDIQATLGDTERANVSIYAIDPRGLTLLGDDTIELGALAGPTGAVGPKAAFSELRVQQDTLRQLAEDSGGLAIVDQNDYRAGFARIVADNSSYYLLGYYPPSTKRDGKFHRIEVKTSRPGLTIRARRGYLAPRGKATAPRKPGGMSQELFEAISSPLPVSGLAMRVFAAPFRGASSNASVLVGIEMLGRHLTLESGKVDISYLAIDAKSKTYGPQNDALTLNLPGDARARVAVSGLRVLNRIELPPGHYQLRVAARDEGQARVGSVICDLEVPDFSRSDFDISGVVLTSLASGALVTVGADDMMRAALPAPPVSQRMFAQNDRLVVFAEVYDRERKRAHKVDIATTVVAEDGQALYKTEETRDSSELSGANGVYPYAVDVPLSEIPPGGYVLRVKATSRIEKDSSAIREIPIAILPAEPAQ
jgi:VWFA-related protein